MVDPVRSFLVRPSALLVLAFVALFKLGEAMAGIMTAPFYRPLTFDKAAIAATGPFSLGGTLVGITLGGWLVARIGVGRALLVTGWAQTVAMAMYVVLSLAPGQHAVLYATVTTEAFAQGLADAAFLTFLSALVCPGVRGDAVRAAVVGAAAGDPHDRRRFGGDGGFAGVDAVLCRVHGGGVAGDAADACPAAAGAAQQRR